MESKEISGLFVVSEKFTRSYIVSGNTLGGGVITEIIAGDDGYYVKGTLKEDYEKAKESTLTFVPYETKPIVEYYPKTE